MTLGEGWHNYHHTFPWDYRAAELGAHGASTTTLLIDMFAKIGWAYDLRYPDKNMVVKTALKNGDGSYAKITSGETEESTQEKIL